MMKMNEYGNIVIYKDKNGKDNIEVKMKDNTVWLTQEQLVKLYNSSKSNISEHIKHIFEEGKLDKNATSVDYDPKAKITQEFFKTVQNKMHWIAHC